MPLFTTPPFGQSILNWARLNWSIGQIGYTTRTELRFANRRSRRSMVILICSTEYKWCMSYTHACIRPNTTESHTKKKNTQNLCSRVFSFFLFAVWRFALLSSLRASPTIRGLNYLQISIQVHLDTPPAVTDSHNQPTKKKKKKRRGDSFIRLFSVCVLQRPGLNRCLPFATIGTLNDLALALFDSGYLPQLHTFIAGTFIARWTYK